MRHNNNPKRSRGRNSGRKGGNPRTQIFDSNGPSVRIRGHALQIFEKYQQLSRDAASAGDRIGAENLQQHAEHYYRVASAAGAVATSERPAEGASESGGPAARDGSHTKPGAPQPSSEPPVTNGRGSANGHAPADQVTGAPAGESPGDTIASADLPADAVGTGTAADTTQSVDIAEAPSDGAQPEAQPTTEAAEAPSDGAQPEAQPTTEAADAPATETDDTSQKAKPRRRGRRSRSGKSNEDGTPGTEDSGQQVA